MQFFSGGFIGKSYDDLEHADTARIFVGGEELPFLPFLNKEICKCL